MSTKSKAKKKSKTKAEILEYHEWCKKHGIDPTGKRKKKTFSGLDKSPVEVKTIYRRETEKIPSLDSGIKGAVRTNTSRHVYTGDKMLGIATMHKSNLVPIFQEDAAVEISHMRR